MKFERIKTNKKRNIIISILFVAVITSIFTFVTSRASYRTTQSINIAHGTINYKMPDLNILALKVQKDETSTDESNYDSADSIPTGSYELNTTKSYCTYSNNGEATNINTNMSKNVCELLFILAFYHKNNSQFKRGKTIFVYYNTH